jgi:hypothetical protein
LTVSVMVALLLRLADVPVMVIENVPITAPFVADKFKRLVAVAGFVPKLAVTPLGRPETIRLTGLVKPFRGLTLMVVEPAAPWRKVKLAGEAERVNPGCGVGTGQLLTRLAASTVPMPVAKSQPTVVL